MKRAVYQPVNKGHFGLALNCYAHFTSPIRRYPDLLVHRGLGHLLDSGKPAAFPVDLPAAEQLGTMTSMQERRADEGTRFVESRCKCLFMEDQVGKTLDGVITGVTHFGLFVMLRDLLVDGLIHVTSLPSDYYHLEPGARGLKGERTGRTFRLGDDVRVRVMRVDTDEARIDLTLDGFSEGKSAGKGVAKEPARKKKTQARFRGAARGVSGICQRLICGIHPVRHVLLTRAGTVERVYLQSDLGDERQARLADALSRAARVMRVSADELEKLTGTAKHQGVAALVVESGPLSEGAARDLLAGVDRPLVLALDGVQDPRNFGACLRTADAAGADLVVVARHRNVDVTPVVSKVAAGAAESQAIVQVSNLVRFLETLKGQGLWIVGTDDGRTPPL
jgi:tRNA G18 (ribose-2'-O)-methylase SpoU